MNAPQPKDNLRLARFHNDWVEITGFEQRRGGHQWPDVAEFPTDDWMKTAVVYLRREDWAAFKAAGFDLRHRFGPVDPPIEALIQNDRIAAVRAADGTEHPVVHQTSPDLHVVSSAISAHNPENGDVALSLVEPESVRRQGDDGSSFGPGKARLYAKMAQAMANLRAIPKRGVNREQGYQYVTDADLYDAVRTEMAKANLALLVRMKAVRKETETKTYRNGDTRDTTTTLVDLDFTLCCGDTGATETIHWTGSTLNPGDKAISAAVTVAEKYFLKATFIISTGDVADDPDSGVSESEPPRSSRVSKRPSSPALKPEASPEAAKSQQPASSGKEDQNMAIEPNGANPAPAETVEMPGDLFQKLMKDKDITAASSSSQERANTIRKLWAEGAITVEQDAFDRALVVIERLQSHRKGNDA